MSKSLSRRQFLGRAAGVALFPAIIPASALGRDGHVAPSNRIAMGFIGVGGKGTNGMQNFLALPETQAVAVCDVQAAVRENARAIANLPAENAYADLRELVQRDDIDAVLVGTPDHWHVPASLAAIRAGKHVYCEKPLSNTIREGRALVAAVQKAGVVFQHGTQLRSLRKVRLACELVRNGRIGALKEIVIGSPPGLATGPHPEEPVPPGLDYNLWLGPAPVAPYTPWRVGRDCGFPGWYFISDYSKSGWVAGYAVHDIDIAHWGMDTEQTGPLEVEGEGVFPSEGLFDTVMTYRLEYKYANGVRLVVTSTDQNPHGVRFVGEQGWIFTRTDIEAGPESILRERIQPDEIRLYESDNHEQNFLDCITSGKPTLTPAEVAHRSTTVGLLGGIALKLRRKLRWNPETERFVDDPEADALLSCPMRAPWEV
jgi:predicted dehydrogenase